MYIHVPVHIHTGYREKLAMVNNSTNINKMTTTSHLNSLDWKNRQQHKKLYQSKSKSWLGTGIKCGCVNLGFLLNYICILMGLHPTSPLDNMISTGNIDINKQLKTCRFVSTK